MPVKPPEVVTTKDGLTAGLIDCARESSVCALSTASTAPSGVTHLQVFRLRHGASCFKPQNQRNDAQGHHSRNSECSGNAVEVAF
jgi:hypothetical protein